MASESHDHLIETNVQFALLFVSYITRLPNGSRASRHWKEATNDADLPKGSQILCSHELLQQWNMEIFEQQHTKALRQAHQRGSTAVQL